jgi:simple sugar transport system permease protein
VSDLVPQQAWLLRLPRTRLHLGFVVAVLAALLVYFVLRRTSLGFRVIAVGSNPKAAEAGGIPPAATGLLALAISGALAGLAGGSEILGIHHRLLDGVTANYGFDAMVVAILGNLHPGGVVLFSFFLAALRVGADALQTQMGVPAAVLHLIEGIVIILLQARAILGIMLNLLRSMGRSIAHWMREA